MDDSFLLAVALAVPPTGIVVLVIVWKLAARRVKRLQRAGLIHYPSRTTSDTGSNFW
ncbi:MAG: hypothetical protein QM604_02085 [Microbacterium sp.]